MKYFFFLVIFFFLSCVNLDEKTVENCEASQDCSQNRLATTCVAGVCVDLKTYENQEACEYQTDCQYNLNGKNTCFEGVCIACEISNEGVEICDDIDNDCDGVIDNGFDLDHDVEHCGACNQNCYEGISDELHLIMACDEKACVRAGCDADWHDADGEESNGCEYSCVYLAEEDNTCNDLDDNCDGLEEDGFLKGVDINNCANCGDDCIAKVGESQRHTMFISCGESGCDFSCKENLYNFDNDLSNGCEVECHYQGEEECDGIDNDCDNEVDEGLNCSCTNGETQDCIVEGTSCSSSQVCSSGSWGTCTPTETWHGPEICDNIDNNCNNEIDEPFKTNDRYTMKEHCGSCNQGCEDRHTTSNECSNSGENIGTCVPKCETGWSNYDANGHNGCETGCSNHKFDDESDQYYKKILQNVNSNYLSTTKEGTNYALIYKLYTSNRYLYARKVDKNGVNILNMTSIMTEENLIDQFYISEASNKFFVVFNQPSIKNVYFRVYDTSFNSLAMKTKHNPLTHLELYDFAIPKKTYLRNTLPVVWSVKESNTNYAIHMREINITTNASGAGTRVLSSTNTLKHLKVATTNNYTGILYCEKTGESTSKLKVHVLEVSKTSLLKQYSESATCEDSNRTSDIASDGTYFYIAYKENNLISFRKLEYLASNSILNFPVNKIATSSTVILGTTKALSLNIDPLNKDLITASVFRSTFFYNGTANVTYALSLNRYNTIDLERKSGNSSQRRLGTDDIKALNPFITSAREMLVFYTAVDSGVKELDLSRTQSCEN